MENAAGALKIAFAVFVFVIAITVAFSLISQAKSASDSVLYMIDKENYQAYTNIEDQTCSLDKVINTLYKYNKESIIVTVNVYWSALSTTVSSSNTNDDVLNTYIKLLIRKYKGEDIKFMETCEEITASGKYIQAEDGTQITINPGSTYLHITYTQI